MPPGSGDIPKLKFVLNPLAAQVQAKLQQAMALHRHGKLVEAQAIYLDILKFQPRHFDCLHLLGVIASQTNNHKSAVDLISKAIEVFPNSAAPYSNRGNALMELKQFDAAVASYDKAIALKPDYVEAYYNRGNALQELKRLDAAVVSYDKAIAIKRDYAEAYYNRGNALTKLKKLVAAVASYDKAIAIRPDHARAYGNRGNALQELKQLEAAVASYDKAVSIKPDYAEAYCNRGNALQDLKQIDAAIASYDMAIAIRPDYAEAHSNRGNALKEFGQVEAAIASYNRAIAMRPDYAEAYWNKSLASLLAGDFDCGLELHEWRWEVGLRGSRRNFNQPLWLGKEPLAGKAILLHSEQGLGDTIQFCRYAKRVAELGARVIMEVPASLLSLLNGLDGVAEFVEKGTTLPDFDFHCPLLSLPLAFKTNLDSIPATQSYLRSDAEKVASWASKLGSRRKPRVGLAWSGSTGHRSDKSRTLALSQLVSYLPDTCEFFSLQKELRETDKAALQAGCGVKHYGECLDDFSDTAALCELMDIVVSVDTSVAHLAGALGKQTRIMLPYCPDWRWLLERTDCVWYPSVRLFRQSAIGDWTNVLEQVRADLLQLSA
jgi:tetratricopeptide (TPR) repeat protein